ncbi:MAG: right-handed parallel beta-helix repeat-containing protein [Flavobacteriales bacterium]|nr:right-handed parallel beta-helix repeat-containing protein [Flavobacteriales bacterium]
MPSHNTLPALLLLAAFPSWSVAQLSGTYVIDGAGGGDYTTFNAAVTDLIAQGISGAVVFEVTDGAYVEYISIPAITGSSATNTITFRGQSLDSTLVSLGHPSSTLSSNNFVIHLNGASYITFEHLTIERSGTLVFGTTIRVQDGSTDWHFANCRINASNSSGNSDVLYYYGSGTGIGSSSVDQCAIAYGGLRLQTAGAGSFGFQGNTMEVNGVFALDIQSLNGDATCTDNTIHCPNYFATAIELSTSNVAPVEIARNTIVCDAPGSYGIELDGVTATSTDPVQVLNNAIILKGFNNVNQGIRLSGTTSYVDVVHNSVSASGSSGTYYGLYVQATCTNVRVHNNALQAKTIAFIAAAASLTSADHNVFHSVAASTVSIDGTNYTDIATLFGNTGMNGNSVIADPLFTDPVADLHLTSLSPCLGAASTWPGLADDVDGEVRPQPAATSPDSGADEDAGACAPLSGTYLIGGSPGADHGTFTSAVNAMLSCGLSGPVVFEVEDGIYPEQFTLPAIPGNSATNTITFRGQSLDSSAVIIRWPAGNAANNYVVQMEGADHVTFEHLTMHRSNGNNSTWGAQVLHFNGFSSSDPSQNCTFSHVRFMANAIQNVNYWRGLVTETTSGLSEQNITFSFCRFQGGHEAFRWNSAAGQDDFLTITDCYTTQSYGAFAVLAMDDQFTISRNTFENLGSTSYTFAISLDYNTGGFLVEDNVVRTVNMYGIRLYANDLTSAAHGVIRNNMIALTATNASAAGIFMFGRAYFLDILNNSISLNGGAGINEGCTLGGSDITLINNVCRVTDAAAYPIYKNGTATWGAISHNALFNAGGGDLAWWNGAAADLNALQGLSGGFCPTVLVDPLFVNNTTDLHLQFGSPCQGMGTNIASVLNDQDGELRPNPVGSNYDMGADETAVCGPLNGTYVIGGTCAAQFASFTAAIDRMLTCGIDGPVVFEVEDGTYVEQITLPAITGNSNVNTITFRGQNLDSSLVVLTWPNGVATPTVRMSGADRVTFEHLTVQRNGVASSNAVCVDWESTLADATTRSEYTTFRNCRLYTNSTQFQSRLVSGMSENDENSVRFENTRFEGGYRGLEWSMDYSALTLEIIGCTFTGQTQRAIALINAGTGDPEVYIEGNTIDIATTSAIAVDIVHNSNLLQVIGNSIRAIGANATALQVQCAAGSPSWRVLRNNMITCWSSARGLALAGTVSDLGIYHNSISTQSGHSLYVTGTGSGNELIGNVLLSASAYPLFLAGSLTFAQAHHDALYTGGANLAYVNGLVYANIPCLQAATGQHASSTSVDPLFVDPLNDLHLQTGSPCTGQGTAVPGVFDDLDGDPRSLPSGSAPDLGADEINEDCTLLGGTYVIGPSVGADLPSFSAAVDRLMGCGIAGPVVFEVENGTYTEQIDLGPIKGANSVNTVTFRGQSLDSTAVVLQWASATVSTNDHVVRVSGADHLRFEHMTLRRTGALTYATVVRPSADCDAVEDLRIARCVLHNSSTGQFSAALVNRGPTGLGASLHLQQCALEGGSYAVYWNSPGTADPLSMIGCTRTGGTQGSRIEHVQGPVIITDNRLTGTSNSDVLLLSDCTGPITVTGNRIDGGSGTLPSAIYLADCAPVAPGRALVANNHVTYGGRYGIRLSGTQQRIDLLHNSIHVSASGAMGMIAAGTGTDVNILNNILSSALNYSVYNTMTGLVMDRNCLYRASTGVDVYWNGSPYLTISALFSGTGTNGNSLMVDPHYYDPLTDLHGYGMEMNAAASPQASVTTDIDGEPRDPATPDIGCDEFIPELWEEALNTCSAADIIISTGSGIDQWIYRDRKVVARFNDNGQNLGAVTMDVYVNSGTVRQSLVGQYYMDRNWHLSTQNTITGSVVLRLYHSGQEFLDYAAADPVVTIPSDAGVAHYVGLMEDCALLNNPAGNVWTPIYPALPTVEGEIQGTGGTSSYTATLDDDGEFYITTIGAPLPVELVRFAAERIDADRVRLDWSTATENDNAGFEVWRRIDDGTDFQRIGWVDGAGNSQQLLTYVLIDPNPTPEVSYYYLRQYDTDGAFDDSPLVAVNGIPRADTYTLYPNPAAQVVYVNGDLAQVSRIVLLDLAGKPVRTFAAAPAIVLADLPRGSYLVRVEPSGADPVHLRLVVD